jgi:pimeloyl-ACP methyl ester carboxylesterase
LIERGILGPLPYAALGTGPPLVVLAGLGPKSGVEGDLSVRSGLGPFLPLAGGRRLVLLNRRPGMPRGITMAAIATEHAEAIRALSPDAPVDVAGVSTGGSVAQQLAADHPDVVRRLVLASTACRLGAHGRTLQRRVGARIRAGAPRRAIAVGAAGSVAPGPLQLAIALTAFLLAPLLARDRDGLQDTATTIEAEDDFDLARCATPIAAPTLIVAGRDDRFYAAELFEETAALIPGADLRLLDGRGHVTALGDGRFRAALSGFLA